MQKRETIKSGGQLRNYPPVCDKLKHFLSFYFDGWEEPPRRGDAFMTSALREEGVEKDPNFVDNWTNRL